MDERTRVIVCTYLSDYVRYVNDRVGVCVSVSPSLYNGVYVGIGKIKLQN